MESQRYYSNQLRRHTSPRSSGDWRIGLRSKGLGWSYTTETLGLIWGKSPESESFVQSYVTDVLQKAKNNNLDSKLALFFQDNLNRPSHAKQCKSAIFLVQTFQLHQKLSVKVLGGRLYHRCSWVLISISQSPHVIEYGPKSWILAVKWSNFFGTIFRYCDKIWRHRLHLRNLNNPVSKLETSQDCVNRGKNLEFSKFSTTYRLK